TRRLARGRAGDPVGGAAGGGRGEPCLPQVPCRNSRRGPEQCLAGSRREVARQAVPRCRLDFGSGAGENRRAARAALGGGPWAFGVLRVHTPGFRSGPTLPSQVRTEARNSDRFQTPNAERPTPSPCLVSEKLTRR